MLWRALWVAFAVAISACDPAVDIEGRAFAPDGGGLNGSAFRIDCPAASHYGYRGPFAAEDGGVFTWGTVGCGPDRDCTLVVYAPGYADWSSSVDALCQGDASPSSCGNSCQEVRFDAGLQP